MKTSQQSRSVPLSTLVHIPPKSYSSTNIEHDTIYDLANYLPSASTFKIIERFSAGLAGAKSGRIMSITGPYGSGKSTMATFLNGLLSSSNSSEWKKSYDILKKEFAEIAKNLVNARKKIDAHDKGLIRCAATARQEPVSATILRALDTGAKEYFGNYSNSDFSTGSLLKKGIKGVRDGEILSVDKIIEIVTDLCKITHIVIMIDEFGKNIEYFTHDEDQQSDLFLLQQLAEMSGKTRKIPLSIITLQHMAFEEYAAGASYRQKREWSKIQGRFEDIPFANSPDQTRQLVYNTIKSGGTPARQKINKWAKHKTEELKKVGIGNSLDSNRITGCYPLDPLALEILPELCSRYGQYERTLLSFLSDAGKHTVASFIDENYWNNQNPPVMGIDSLYDYFISGTNMIHSSSAHITRLMEIETIIRDAHGLTDLELKTLKTIGILNLIGRSGYLRASKKIIGYSIGTNAKQILKGLEKKSIITYRKHADEYRIWHGTDIDIAINLDLYRKRYQNTPLVQMLSGCMSLDPIIAARHSIEKGTMRIFERQFTTESEINLQNDSDGVIVYRESDSITPTCSKPVITITAKNTDDLKRAVIEVMTIQSILNDDENVKNDWVVRKELEERLAEARIILYRAFNLAYGHTIKWMYEGKAKKGTPSAIVSEICDEVYFKTPIIHNEMINKTVLSSQIAAARRTLLEAMLVHPNKPRFGIEGYGPERAIYEAMFYENKIHVSNSQQKWQLRDPKNQTIAPAWNVIIDTIKQSKGRITMSEIYHTTQIAPYGIREGVSSILIITILALYKHNIALYEHGTYVPNLTIEIVERMLKNSDHFEFKYFKSTESKKELLKKIIEGFEINSEGSVLDVVSHLVRTVSALPPYVKHTKNLPKSAISIRDTVFVATEPDTLLFESLPKALGFDFTKKHTDSKIPKFVKILVKSTQDLQTAFSETIIHIKKLLFETTAIDDRAKLSKIASIMLSSVTDENMRKFLTAISTDALERDEDWINYVAMSITDVPMMNWTDKEYEMFENKIQELSSKFEKLTSVHFANISDNFVKPSYQITITHADGSEHNNVVSLRPEQEKKIESIAEQVLQDMRKKRLSNKDLEALVAVLISKSK